MAKHNLNSENKPQIKSLRQLLELLGEQMDSLRPQNEPTDEGIKAAGACSRVTNSYLGAIKIGIQAAKLSGQKPDLSFFGVVDPDKQIAS